MPGCRHAADGHGGLAVVVAVAMEPVRFFAQVLMGYTDFKKSSESVGNTEAVFPMSGRVYVFAILDIFSTARCRPVFPAPCRVPPAGVDSRPAKQRIKINGKQTGVQAG